MKSNRELIYPELSYKIMGILFKVHNKLGSTYQEKYYQRAIETEFKKENINYEREKMVKIIYNQNTIGKYFTGPQVDPAHQILFGFAMSNITLATTELGIASAQLTSRVIVSALTIQSGLRSKTLLHPQSKHALIAKFVAPLHQRLPSPRSTVTCGKSSCNISHVPSLLPSSTTQTKRCW